MRLFHLRKSLLFSWFSNKFLAGSVTFFDKAKATSFLKSHLIIRLHKSLDHCISICANRHTFSDFELAMSVLDAFFNKGFKAAKCKTLLKLTIPRIKLLRNKRENQLKQMRRDIAKLLENGQEATARIRVEHIIREENMMAAQEIIELFCELIAVRLPIIETQRECPLDLKEAIASVCFAAPRCSDLPELQQVQMLFAAKYGREFVAAASELLPDCGVNRQIIELLSVRAPSVEARLKLLKEIAEEHEVEWDPAASETEFLKPHEDLLNGPNPALPLPEVKQEGLTSSITPIHHEKNGKEAESDEDFDLLNLPEVPKAAVQATTEASSANDSDHIRFEPSKYSTDEFGKPNITSLTMKEIKQFQYVPFVAPPPPPPPSFSSPTTEKTELSPPSQPPHFPSSSDNSEPSSVYPNYSLPLEKNNSTTLSHSVPKQKEIGKGIDTSKVDLQDVLAAARAAADSADQAAQAARAAASLAQLRIAEIVKKPNLNSASETKVEKEANITEEPSFTQQNSFEYNNMPNYDDKKDYMHQPQRSVSLEDDPYFSYPNLFSRQNSEINKPAESSTDEHSGFSK